jgi:hypothetical protein
METLDLHRLHKLSGWHEDAIQRSDLCGCFCCVRIFARTEIVEWVDEPPHCPRGPGKTAICPLCGVDAVLPEEIGQPLTVELLTAMNEKWFGEDPS